MKRLIAAALLAFAFLFDPAEAQQVTTGTCQGANIQTAPSVIALCSYTWFQQGPCNGGNVQTNIMRAAFPESVDVTIRAVNFAFFNSGRVLYAQAGNGGGSPDIMLQMGEGLTSAHWTAPPGTGMPWYAATGSLIDSHVTCDGSVTPTFNLFYTIYYTVP